jgi:hypothetical protein
MTNKVKVIERACRQLYRTHRTVYMRIDPNLFDAFKEGKRFLMGGDKVVKVLRVTLLSALLLWLVWRKTRPACNGRGFPVDVAGKEATKP